MCFVLLLANPIGSELFFLGNHPYIFFHMFATFENATGGFEFLSVFCDTYSQQCTPPCVFRYYIRILAVLEFVDDICALGGQDRHILLDVLHK
jgi:hypothetical protein